MFFKYINQNPNVIQPVSIETKNSYGLPKEAEGSLHCQPFYSCLDLCLLFAGNVLVSTSLKTTRMAELLVSPL
jgi:hypothetical protein